MRHHHHHTHAEGDHTHHHEEANKTFLVAMALNAGFVVLECIYGFSAHSLALLADAGHNALDVLGIALAWGAAYLAKLPPKGRFTYGLQSASILSAVLNAFLTLGAGLEIGVEAIRRLLAADNAMPNAIPVMWVALCGVLINGITAWLFLKGSKNDVNYKGVFVHMAGDALVSLAVAASGLTALYISDFTALDPLVALSIGALIMISAAALLDEAIRLILHASPKHIDPEDVKGFLESLPNAPKVRDLHVWAISSNENSLSAHVVMQENYPGREWFRDTERELEERYRIGHSTIQVELEG